MQTYHIIREMDSNISDFFLGKFWDELFDVRDNLYIEKSEDPLIDTFDSYRKLRSLVLILPKDMKQTILPQLEKFDEITDEDKEVVRHIGPRPVMLLNGVPFGEEEYERRKKQFNILARIFRKRLEEIVK